MSFLAKSYPMGTSFEKIKKDDSKLGNLVYNVIHKERVYPLSYEGITLMQQDNFKYKFFKFNEKYQLSHLLFAVCSVLLLSYVVKCAPYWLVILMKTAPVFATPYQRADKAGKAIVDLAQYGIKWLSMIVVFYGLYMQLLKKDDLGKKIAVGAGLTYIISLLVPAAYDVLDMIFK